MRDQLDSIILQLPKNAEIIISDNGSTDRTLDIIKSYNIPQLKLLHNRSKGAVNNFHFALQHATGEFIFLSDQDDLWKPDKIQTCLAYLKKFDLVCHDCEIVDEASVTKLKSYFLRRKSGNGFIKNLWSNSYLGCCMAFKKEVLDLSLPFPPQIPMHDMWLGLVGDLFFKTHFIPKQLVHYRMHSSNLSPTSGGQSPYSLQEKLQFRWNIIKYVPLLLSRKYFRKTD